jgi:hypothetical protein
MDIRKTQQGQDQPRKAGTTAQIDEGSGARRDQGPKLGRIQKMAAPDVIERLRADEIDRLLPFGDEGGVGLEALECFT